MTTFSFFTDVAKVIYDQNCKVGWHDEAATVPPAYYVATKIALAHSELSEALEGVRKDLMDDHLPQHKMEAVEYADAIIRILDLAAHRGYDIGAVIFDKLAYNLWREKHLTSCAK